MTDDENPTYPNTARYWRYNTLLAYRGVNLTESMAADPEHLEWIKAAKAEIKAINERNNAVKTRHARIYGRKATP